ncbi:hypothetical protein GW746_00985 [Candidatus Saccharibacteria bacterium]|nr:hypothetical protein [Candidatus Saccharibacteria bacterium]NCS82979.1 hypothetical protein [Candidatus Saccharibacteria bacterium]
MISRAAPLHFIDKLFIGLLLSVFGGIVLHAPLIVSLGTVFPEADLFIKAWKEVLLAIAAGLFLVIYIREKRPPFFKTPLFIIIAAYIVLHLLLIPVFFSGIDSTIAGLMIDLRFLAFFVLVYGAAKLYPQLSRLFLWTFFSGAAVVAGFALLQVTVLPDDVLSGIGYSTSTIAPYLTIDQNTDYVRINSTLRGPNPLGAYAVIVIASCLAYWLKTRRAMNPRRQVGLGALVFASTIALWASYSRSAAFAAIVTIGLVLAVAAGRKYAKYIAIASVAGMLAATAGLVIFRDSSFVSNVVLHVNPEGGSETTSNIGHIDSLIDGTQRMAQQPLGAGVGSTGSASLLSDEPVIIENQYLLVAHETGWLGLALFMTLQGMVLWGLWRRHLHWLALGLGASGVGMVFIGLLLPVWVDDTVAIIWWGLAAVALAFSAYSNNHKRDMM